MRKLAVLAMSLMLVLPNNVLANGKPQPIPQWAQQQLSKNDNHNSNHNTNIATGGKSQASAVAKGGRGGNAHATGGKAIQDQKQGQKQRQLQRQNARSQANNNVNVDASQDYETAASSAIASVGNNTAPCIKSAGLGIQTLAGGVSGVVSSGDMWCRAYTECADVTVLAGATAGLVCMANYSPLVHRTLVDVGLIAAE